MEFIKGLLSHSIFTIFCYEEIRFFEKSDFFDALKDVI